MDSVYCLFVETGREAAVEKSLGKLGLSVISSMSSQNVVRHGRQMVDLRPILRGYVFFAAEGKPDWKAIAETKYVYYPLRYSDGTKELRRGDLQFVRWLRRRGSPIGLSRAIQEGKRIRIVDGPLKEYEGSILRINKRQKCAEVQIDLEGIINTIWLSYDLLLTKE